MNLKKQIKKVVCSMLVILISFIISICNIGYATDISTREVRPPRILEPTDTEKQFIELRAVKVKEIEGEGEGAGFQLLTEVWVRGLEITGFTVRLTYDSTKIQPSTLTGNLPRTDIGMVDGTDVNEIFEFAKEQNESGETVLDMKENVGMQAISEDESTLLIFADVLQYQTTPNKYIQEKDIGDGKTIPVLNAKDGERSRRSINRNI